MPTKMPPDIYYYEFFVKLLELLLFMTNVQIISGSYQMAFFWRQAQIDLVVLALI